jgi:hypothetical protein
VPVGVGDRLDVNLDGVSDVDALWENVLVFRCKIVTRTIWADGPSWPTYSFPVASTARDVGLSSKKAAPYPVEVWVPCEHSEPKTVVITPAFRRRSRQLDNSVK